MKSHLFLLAAISLAAPLTASEKRPEREVSAAQLRGSVEKLVSFGTRHTMSDTTSETRGIGAARRWAQGQFDQFSQSCGGCLAVETVGKTFEGRRLPTPTEVVNVMAVQRGTQDPERVIIISAHIDSRNSDPLDAVGEAPGANDDGSGTAAVIEAARVLSAYRFPATIVYALLSGEEQGLYGGKLLAETAIARAWKVEAVLNNDIVGNSTGSSGAKDDRTVRVFSEGTRATETPEQANSRRYNGGEVDSPARNLARFVAARGKSAGLNVEMIYRTDRYGRGGDQVRMLEAGFPAVRITERQENYDRQHQNLRTEDGRVYGDTIDGVDFNYLGKVTRLNVATLAALARAPGVPAGLTIAGAVSPDTTLKWQPVPGAAGYRVWWRKTISPVWEYRRDVPQSATEITLEGIDIDSWFFGVAAVGTDGAESPVVFPGPAGDFTRPQPPQP
ncbi:MAG: M20/M25/M40 family metallo-hydrolase [Polymorphobacter sp.]|uniref:M20/M25/M40 family metallo-hydrolase n=1 Tax=Polymorphobacter sp. TaxID=1909290 RepID=UPI003A89846D